MKTPLNTSTQNLNHTRERVRLAMTVAGIVTAIICSVALLSETPFMQLEVSMPRMGAPKIVTADLPVKIVGSTVISAIWPF